jgi:ubiquinol-cytochrome c reductase iron-sulfur subunit
MAQDEGGDGVRRRDFINIAAVSAAGVGALAVIYPLVSQMAPSADVLAEGSTEVDISAIQPGQAIKAVFRNQPLFIRNLTADEVTKLTAFDGNPDEFAKLKDPQKLTERTQEGKANWLVTMGVCTHLGCVPMGAGEGEVKGDFDGYFCPCHGSHYDLAARIRKGPAPKNLEVPEYTFLSDTVIKIG